MLQDDTGAAVNGTGEIEVPPEGSVLTPSEVARFFNVDPKTVTRWAKSGKIDSFRTPGGHRRYYAADVLALIEKGSS